MSPTVALILMMSCAVADEPARDAPINAAVRRVQKQLGRALDDAVATLDPNGPADAEPRLGVIIPRGGQRGTTVRVELAGKRLGAARAVLIDGDGIRADPPFRATNGKINCLFHLAPDAAPGLRLCRVVTDGGISNPVLFAIGALSETKGTEDNNSPATANAITLPVTINGVITNEDVDMYAFDAVAGQTIAFEIVAMRLCDALFDPCMTIYDADGRPLASADDTPPLGSDCAIVFAPPANGRYVIEVRETSYRGGGNFRYRLSAGAFPRPLGIVPCGGASGAEFDAVWLGDPTLSSQHITIPPNADTVTEIVPTSDAAAPPTGVPFRVTALSVATEAEPNNDIDHATPMTLPGAAGGVIGAPGDIDWFTFDTKKDQPLEIRVIARQLGSALDSVLHVQRVGADGAAGNDDAGGLDSYVQFKSTDDGKLAVAVRDLLGKGGDAYTYLLEVEAPRPRVELRLNDPLDAGIAIPAGNRGVMIVTATRAGFGGPLVIEAADLPAGVTITAPAMHPAVSQMPIVLEAPRMVNRTATLSTWTVRHEDANKGIRGGLRHTIDMVKYNDLPFQTRTVDRVAVAVTQPAPISIELDTPATPIVARGSMRIPFHVIRHGKFKGDIVVRLAWTPPGIGAGTITLKEGQTEGELPLDANGGPALGTWPLVAIAETRVGDGKLTVASGMTTLDVVAPLSDFEIQRTRTEIGVNVELKVKIKPSAPFEGDATLTLLGLPPKVTSAPLTINKDATELTFPLTLEDGAPPGHHGGVFVFATIPSPTGDIIHRSPAGLLIIDKPLPPKDPAEEAARAEARKNAAEEKQRKMEERRAAAEKRRQERESRRTASTQPAT